MVKKNDNPSSDNDLIFGRYNKQIDYRNGQVSQVLEYKTESLMPNSPTNIDLPVDALKDMIYEGIGGGYKSVGVEIEFTDDHKIKLVRKNFMRKLKIK
ncbi:hypothetical protein EUA78_00570 [TM7 phylum sp. oral taxon 351]|nr:hypothetical protein EUA78_00570 [TM7 phylum sp. oral taxon 351]